MAIGHSEEVVGRALAGDSCRRPALRVYEMQPGVGRRTAPCSTAFKRPSIRRELKAAFAGFKPNGSISTRYIGRSGRRARRDTRHRDRWKKRGKRWRRSGRKARCPGSVCRTSTRQSSAHSEDRAADQPAAAVFPAAARDRTGDSAVLPRASHRRHPLLPDAVRIVDGKDDTREDCGAACGRFPPQQPLLSGADVDQRPGAGGAAAIHRQPHGRSPGEVAIAWLLAHPAITAVIVGARRPDQVDDLIGRGGFPPER